MRIPRPIIKIFLRVLILKDGKRKHPNLLLEKKREELREEYKEFLESVKVGLKLSVITIKEIENHK